MLRRGRGPLSMGLTDFPRFPVLPAPLPAYRKHAVLWVLTQEPGDSAAIELQLQEATEQTEPHGVPKCPRPAPVPQDSLTGS